VFQRNGTWMAYFPDTKLQLGERVEDRFVRCRTVGDRKTTGFIESQATDSATVLNEIIHSRYSERAGRAEDKGAKTGMEDRKQGGWF
jgi:sulfate adenylyltransferase subunit 2